MEAHRYKIRYLVESWNKPPAGEDRGGPKVRSNVTVSRSDHGYTDDIFLASIVRDENGDVESVLLLDSDGPNPSREILELVKRQNEHHLANHT